MFLCDHTLLCWAEYAPHLWCHVCIALLICYIYLRLLFGIACLAYHTAIKFALYQLLYPEFIVNSFDIKRAAATFVQFVAHSMANIKYFTHTFRVLRLLVETVIHNTVHEANDDADLISHLQYCARSSKTAKFWAGGLMNPVFLMMIFCQAEQEVYRPLDLRAYFFTARQHNCARFWYVLPSIIRSNAKRNM